MTGLRAASLLCFVAILTSACSTNSDPRDSAVALSVLTLNLHTYQEMRTTGLVESSLDNDSARQRIKAYGPIFDRIAAGITELNPDIICFQEVGEWPGGENDDLAGVQFGASDTNMVKQILSRLDDRHYFYTMDWSHYGWNVWLEGSAILSKYPLSAADSRYISSPENSSHQYWKSRNVPMAQVDVPQIGNMTIFSVHTGWWDDPDEPFRDQYQRLLNWVAETTEPGSTSVLCGDFNIPAGGPIYRFMTDDSGYADQYLLANPDGMFDATVGGGIDGWTDSEKGQRIDYILLNEKSGLEVIRARRVFTADDLGRVSDHVGIYAEFAVTRGR